MIEFAFDFASSASLLALKPTQALAEELGVEVVWRPFPTDAPRATPQPSAEESVAERHARVRAEYHAKDFARYAKVQGIEVKRAATAADTTLASIACLQARRHGVEGTFVAHVFREFWAGRLNIEEHQAVADALAEVGGGAFDAEPQRAEYDAERQALAERGVYAVPTYLVAEQLFTGRQHLPMIRWLLSGEEGPGPL